MLEGKAEIGKNVLVAGGGMIGCEAAEYLAERGHQVTIVEMKSVIAEDVAPEHKRYMFENFERNHVKLYANAQITQFYQDGVSCIIKDGEPIALRGYDTILLAMGTRAFNPFAEAASDAEQRFFVIGEALNSPGNVVTVTTDALNFALEVR